jgi:hypothetical protein
MHPWIVATAHISMAMDCVSVLAHRDPIYLIARVRAGLPLPCRVQKEIQRGETNLRELTPSHIHTPLPTR